MVEILSNKFSVETNPLCNFFFLTKIISIKVVYKNNHYLADDNGATGLQLFMEVS